MDLDESCLLLFLFPGQSNHRHYQTNFRHHSKHPGSKNLRRQDSSKSIRYPPAHKKHIIDKQQKQQNRRNHKKPPPTNHFNHIGQKTKKTKSSFSFVPDFNTLQALNPFNFFDQSRLTFTTPPDWREPRQVLSRKF